MNLETVQSRDVFVRGPFGSTLGMYHEEHMWKARTEVRPIDIMMPITFRRVQLHTLGTVEFHHDFADHFRETDLRMK